MAVSLFILVVSLFFVPNYVPFEKNGNNYFRVYVNDVEVGNMASVEQARNALRLARRQLARESSEVLYLNADLQVEGVNVMWGKIDAYADVISRMKQAMQDKGGRSTQYSLHHCYTVKMGAYTINMKTTEDIVALLNEVLENYDPNREYVVNLIPDASREINVLTSEVLSTREQEKKDQAESYTLPLSGIEQTLQQYLSSVTPRTGNDLEDFDLGLQEIGFGEKIEVTEAFMPENQIVSLEDALLDVTGDVARNQEYTVVSGDSISVIAQKFGLSTDQLIGMNAILSDSTSMIRPGDILTVSAMEPKLSVVYTNQEYYEEDYQADTIYQNNDEWYTTKQEVIQEAETGHRKVVAQVAYKDGNRTASSILKAVTTKFAVPRIVEIGTKNPPTFIWPCSVTRLSSGFGRRKQPKAGASTNHQGLDIAAPTGTAVWASSGGKVTVAGWQSGYGNVVYIDHGDGKSTRYGHLSKILVRVGQHVSQGEVIARSGNTGNSTGPHLHFEIRVNGSAVDPRTYTGY